MKKKVLMGIVMLVLLAAVVLTACSSQSSTSGPGGNPPSGTMPGPSQAAATTAAPTATATAEPTATITPAPTATGTPVTYSGSIITAIMCQSGPGENYTRTDYLSTGQTVTVHGRDAEANYFLIDSPNHSGQTCWIWKNYITVNGAGYSLPVATVAPTATK